jgi:hypothetical protein
MIKNTQLEIINTCEDSVILANKSYQEYPQTDQTPPTSICDSARVLQDTGADDVSRHLTYSSNTCDTDLLILSCVKKSLCEFSELVDYHKVFEPPI